MERPELSVLVQPEETLLFAFGGRDAHELALTMPIEKKCITSLVALSIEDTQVCFMEMCRRIICEAICEAAMALARVECLGCRIEHCGQIPIPSQHSICGKSPDELLRTPTYGGFFTGFLFAGGPGGFLIDNRYYNQIAPYVNINSLLGEKKMATWFPPTTVLGIFLRKIEGFSVFFNQEHPNRVKDLFLYEGIDVDTIMIFMHAIVCPQSTRALVVLAKSEKELARDKRLSTDVKSLEGVTPDDTKVYRGVKRFRGTDHFSEDGTGAV